MILSVKTFGNTWTVSQPLPLLPVPGKVRPNPLLPNCSVFWHKGDERKLLLCSLGHFLTRLACLVFGGGSDTSASFHINWPFRHVPWLCDFVSDLSTCLFPPRSKCTLCIPIPMDQKGSHWRSPTKPPPSWQPKAAFQILDVFAKNKKKRLNS